MGGVCNIGLDVLIVAMGLGDDYSVRGAAYPPPTLRAAAAGCRGGAGRAGVAGVAAAVTRSNE